MIQALKNTINQATTLPTSLTRPVFSMKNKIKLTSFIISLLYVFIGTVVVIVGFPKYEMLGFDHNHPLWRPLFTITYPVNIFLFGLVMVDNSILSIIILQTIVFCLFWFILHKILMRIYRHKQ